MPGPWVKDWKTYEELRKEGKDKTTAAKIANAAAAKKGKKHQRSGKLRFRDRKRERKLRRQADSDSDYAD